MDYPCINVIYDSRHSDRYGLILDEFVRQGITKYLIWDCISKPNVVQSINESHKMIVRQAKESGMKECAIAEDDIFFPSEKGWEWFLKNKPETFDIYSSGNYNSFVREDAAGAVRTDTIVGLHLYIIHEKYYDRFLETPENKHIDTEQKGDLYFCYPMAALQRPGYSANNMAIVNYNSSLKPEDIYS